MMMGRAASSSPSSEDCLTQPPRPQQTKNRMQNKDVEQRICVLISAPLDTQPVRPLFTTRLERRLRALGDPLGNPRHSRDLVRNCLQLRAVGEGSIGQLLVVEVPAEMISGAVASHPSVVTASPPHFQTRPLVLW